MRMSGNGELLLCATIFFSRERYLVMSHTDGNTFGLEHGKIGDRIAVVLNGKQVYKRLYKPTNPRTPKQQMHRAKLAYINRLSKVLAEAVNLGFALAAKSDAMSARNAFVKANWANGALVWMEWDEHEAGVGAPKGGDGNDGPSGKWALVPERLMLASGTRHIGMGMTATVRDGRLHIDCPDPGLDDPHAVKDDRLMVAVYRPAAEKVRLFEGPLRKDCRESDYDLPAEWNASEGERANRTDDKEDTVYVYVWFQATRYHRSGGGKVTVRPGQASASVCLGGFTH